MGGYKGCLSCAAATVERPVGCRRGRRRRPDPAMSTPRSTILRSAGGILLVWAAFSAIFGQPQPALAWGPVLFRSLLVFHGLVLIASPWLWREAEPPSASNPVRGKILLALIGLSVVAFALRIPGLNSCMWLDEILTMVRYARPPAYQILTTFPDQNQHM